MTWRRKRHGTTAAYEAAQERVLALMRDWRQPEEVVIHQFVVRSGEAATAAAMRCSRPTTSTPCMRRSRSSPASTSTSTRCVDIDVALAAKGVAIEWRDAAV